MSSSTVLYQKDQEEKQEKNGKNKEIQKKEEKKKHVVSKEDQEKINIMRSAGCDWDVEDFDYFMSK